MMKRTSFIRPVIFWAFMMLVWQGPISAYSEGIQLDLPEKELCTTCTSGPAHTEIPRITIEELKEMMNNAADMVILDSRPKNIYDEGHIEGALSFPWASKLTQHDVRQLPRDKMIIIYCDCGPGEADSSELAVQLREMGFNNVRVLADPSIRGWIKAGYPTEK